MSETCAGCKEQITDGWAIARKEVSYHSSPYRNCAANSLWMAHDENAELKKRVEDKDTAYHELFEKLTEARKERDDHMSASHGFQRDLLDALAQLREAKREIEFQKITMEGTEEELQAAQQQAVAYKAELKKEIYRAEHCLECGGNVRCVSMCLFRELNPEIAIDASKPFFEQPTPPNDAGRGSTFDLQRICKYCGKVYDLHINGVCMVETGGGER